MLTLPGPGMFALPFSTVFEVAGMQKLDASRPALTACVPRSPGAIPCCRMQRVVGRPNAPAFDWLGQKLPSLEVVFRSGAVRSGLRAIGSAPTNCPSCGGQSMLVSCDPCGVHAPPGFAPALHAPLIHFGHGE